MHSVGRPSPVLSYSLTDANTALPLGINRPLCRRDRIPCGLDLPPLIHHVAMAFSQNPPEDRDAAAEGVREGHGPRCTLQTRSPLCGTIPEDNAFASHHSRNRSGLHASLWCRADTINRQVRRSSVYRHGALGIALLSSCTKIR